MVKSATSPTFNSSIFGDTSNFGEAAPDFAMVVFNSAVSPRNCAEIVIGPSAWPISSVPRNAPWLVGETLSSRSLDSPTGNSLPSAVVTRASTLEGCETAGVAGSSASFSDWYW
jgi:hypothetical protein